MSQDNPYRAPDSALHASVSHSSKSAHGPIFRDAKNLAMAVHAFVSVYLVAHVINIAAMLHERYLINRQLDGVLSMTDIQTSLVADDRWIMLSGLLIWVLLIACYIVGGMWTYRVARNVRALGAHNLDDRPAWAVGWYFIPFANFVLPFRAMVQIRLASATPDRWRSDSAPALLIAWWAAFITCNFVGILARMRTSEPATSLAELATRQFWLSMYNLVAMLAAVLFALVVRNITQIQFTTSQTPRQENTRANLADHPAFASL